MSLLRTNMRPRLRFAVVLIVILLILPGVATTHGDHGVASTLAPQRTQALSMRSYNTATGPHPGPLSNTGAIVATLVLKNGTVVPGNFLGSGVGVVASAIVYDTANGQFYVPNSAQSNSTFPNTVIGFYGSNESITGKTGVGQEPDAVAYDSSNGYICVANLGSASVSFVSPVTGSVVDTVAVGAEPISIAFDPYSGYLFVANSGSGNVTVVNGSNQRVVLSVGTGTGTDAVAYDSQNGNAYVASEQSSNLTVINGTNGTAVGSVTAGAVGVTALAWDSVSGNLYATGGDIGKIYAIDPTTDSVVTTFPDTYYPVALEYDSLNGYLYAANDLAPTYGNVTVINTTGESTVGMVTVGNDPSGIAVDSTSGDVFITNAPTGTVSVLDPSAAGPQEYLSSVAISPRFSNMVTNQSEVLSARPTCYPASCGVGVNFAWQISNGDGSLNRSGGNPVTFFAGNIPGNETVTVQASLNGSAYVATALVNISSPLQSVRITPSSVAVPPGGNTSFHVIPNCSPSPCPTIPTYSWSLNNSLGSLNTTSGSVVRFDAGAHGGNVTLQVSALIDGRETSASAQVSIIDLGFGASLSESASSGPTPLVVAFSATGIGGRTPYTFVWAFGDGLTGTGTDVKHSYTTPGSYSVVLIGYDANNQTTHLTTNVVAYAPPSTGFVDGLAIALSGNPVTGPAPLTTTLSAAVTGGAPPYTYEWIFGGTFTQVGGSSITHTYGQPGEYVATLYVSDSDGNAAETGVFISVSGGAASSSDQLAVAVTVLSLRGTAPLKVQFYPAVMGGSGPFTLTWAFGGGSPSLTTQNVTGISHTYESNGVFFPSLTVRDSNGAIANWTVEALVQPSAVVGAHGLSPSSSAVTITIAVVGSVVALLIMLVVVRRGSQTLGGSDHRSSYGEYRSAQPTQRALEDRPPPVPASGVQEEDPEADML